MAFAKLENYRRTLYEFNHANGLGLSHFKIDKLNKNMTACLKLYKNCNTN